MPVPDKKMSADKRKTIYGMATQLGIYDKQNKDDDLHALVLRVTGKESISQLSDKDASMVIRELVKLKGGREAGRTDPPGNPPEKKQTQKQRQHRPGMITPGMQKTVWYHMYRLLEMDNKPSQMTLGERLCAVIKKFLRVDAIPQDPMRFVTFDAGNTLIEILKKMVEYEERKAGVKAK